MANYSDKSKKLIKEILIKVLEKSKTKEANWLFLCVQIRYVVNKFYDGDTRISFSI